MLLFSWNTNSQTATGDAIELKKSKLKKKREIGREGKKGVKHRLHEHGVKSS